MVLRKNNFTKYDDERGCFYEVPNITGTDIAQSSISISKKNVLRGLHFQYSPQMGKQINVLNGSILDCIVDLRLDSANYGTHEMILCSSKDNNSIYVPPGFAHGFLSLEDNTTVMYFQTSLYNKEGEGAICPFDEHLNIDWGIDRIDCIVSEKDKSAQSFVSFSNQNFNWRIL